LDVLYNVLEIAPFFDVLILNGVTDVLILEDDILEVVPFIDVLILNGVIDVLILNVLVPLTVLNNVLFTMDVFIFDVLSVEELDANGELVKLAPVGEVSGLVVVSKMVSVLV
jgi:hypothetical protein